MIGKVVAMIEELINRLGEDGVEEGEEMNMFKVECELLIIKSFLGRLDDKKEGIT